MPFADMAFAALQEGKKQFGEYSYHDKGASEIIDVAALSRELKKLDDQTAVSELLKLAEMEDTHLLVSELLIENQNWDALFENDDLAELL